LGFGIGKLGGEGENGLFDFAGDSAIGIVEKGVFNQLLSEGGTAFETFASQSVERGTENAGKIETMMGIEVFIFNRDSAFLDIKGNVGDGDGSTFVLGINFKEKFAVAIKDLSTDRRGGFGKFGGIGNVFENKNQVNKENTGKNSQNRKEAGMPSFDAFSVAFFDGMEKLFPGESHGDYIIPV